jgi:hypothetical protein
MVVHGKWNWKGAIGLEQAGGSACAYPLVAACAFACMATWQSLRADEAGRDIAGMRPLLFFWSAAASWLAGH